jgi:hypothetical protein
LFERASSQGRKGFSDADIVPHFFGGCDAGRECPLQVSDSEGAMTEIGGEAAIRSFLADVAIGVPLNPSPCRLKDSIFAVTVMS